MEFQTIKDISECIGVEPQVISNYFHGLIKPRGFLKYCILYQSIPLWDLQNYLKNKLYIIVDINKNGVLQL